LAGDALAAQCLTELNESFGVGVSPLQAVPSTNYSARFTKTIDEGAGTYVFSISRDNGASIFVDGERIFDGWAGSAGTVKQTVSVPLSAGPHDVVVKYYQGGGSAKLVLTYKRIPRAES
jgi:hypothetical protein